MRFHHRLHGHVPDCHPFRHEAAQEHLCSAKTVLTTGLLAVSTAGFAQPARTTAAYMENLELTREWDKVFPQSDKVNHSKITFARMFGDALTDMPTGKTTEVAFGSTQTWAGIPFEFRRGATFDFPGASILIGGKVYFTHWVPSKSHASHLQIS